MGRYKEISFIVKVGIILGVVDEINCFKLYLSVLVILHDTQCYNKYSLCCVSLILRSILIFPQNVIERANIQLL